MKYKLLFFCAFYTTFCFSQAETSVWYFGENAGIKFHADGSVTPLVDGQLNTLEGCATLSDSNGDLMFYTDGVTVYNKNHQIMLNGTGLKGHLSSTQSATIIQKPGSSNLFYVFTVDAVAKVNGLMYSEIDINLDGGLGGITAVKNIPIYSPTCEKLSVVKHTNNIDFWIITHGWGSNRFYAHQVNSTGISTTPTVSNSGIIVGTSSDIYETQGYMKISPNGKKLALCHQFSNSVELFDFDTSTGIVSNPKFINNKGQSYGVEFSPNSEVLYVSLQIGSLIYQYDLNSSNIALSEKLIVNAPTFLGALQLGPNNKIYIANYKSADLGVINDPNVLGLGCNLETSSVKLAGRKSMLGLPAFNQSFFNPSFGVKDLCLGETTKFILSSTIPVSSAIWDFGDGTSANAIDPVHVYASAGNYNVKVEITSSSGTAIKSKDIIISAIPKAIQPQNLLFCDNNNDGFSVFDLTMQNATILNGQDPNLVSVNYFANSKPILTPNNYKNSLAYQEEVITAEVSNKINTNCKSITSFTIDVFDSPKPLLSVSIPKLMSCDNSSVGNDTDSRVIFDLTQKESAILNGQSASQFDISYYKDLGLTQPIMLPTEYKNTTSTETIFVQVKNKDNPICNAITSFEIEVFALPVISNVVDLKQCDDDIDGFSVFNLEESIAKITSNASNETIGFFRTITDAQNNTNPISNTTTYANTVVNNDAVYARVSNSNNCFRIARLNLTVSTTQIPLTFSKSFTQCDDAASGSNTDGITTFDFSSVTKQVQAIFPLGQLLDITYYKNLNDALAENNAIGDITNYSNIDYPDSQKIYVRVDSRLNNDCLGLGGYITLNVEPIPIAKSIVETHCDDNQDGLFAFDTSNFESRILNGLTNVTISYLDQNNNPLPSPLPNPFLTASQTVKVKVTNNTASACSYEAAIAFVVDRLPQVFPIARSLTTFCDDEIDPALQDGKYPFDTATFQNNILGNQTEMIVRYYDANGNALASPLPNPFVTATQDIKVEVVNPLNQSCISAAIISFKVNQVPTIKLTGDELVCSDLPTFTKTINAGLVDETKKADYTYSWTLDGNLIIGENRYDLIVNKKGIYKVETTNADGCSRTRTITVNASDKANVQVDIVDLSTENSITVLTTGSGDYVFSLDDEFGEYQNNPIFENVTSGIHTVYVKDLNGCGIVSKEAAILGIPKFFTPNQDGSNDTWNINGINDLLDGNTSIQVFDRYGKLIKQINPQGDGWDGTYLGKQMPSDDYWYLIKLNDGRIFKGHFTLKR